MKTESPKCSNCSKPLTLIGGVGKQVHYENIENGVVGVSEVKLYQCPYCKIVDLI